MFRYLAKGRHTKKNCMKSEKGTIGGEGVRKIIEFSSFTNDKKHRRGEGAQSYISSFQSIEKLTLNKIV